MRRLVLIGVVLGLTTACAGASDPAFEPSPSLPATEGPAASSELVQPVGGDLRVGEPWYFVGGMLETLDPPEAPVVLTFGQDRARGQGPINTYSASYTTGDSGELTFGGWEATQVGGSKADLRLETQIQAYLRQVDGYTTVALGELYLFDGDSNVLVYATQPPGSGLTVDDETQAVALHIIGMSEAEARSAVEAAGLTLRVVARDGTALLVTEDYSVSRINATIVDDQVTETTIG